MGPGLARRRRREGGGRAVGREGPCLLRLRSGAAPLWEGGTTSLWCLREREEEGGAAAEREEGE